MALPISGPYSLTQSGLTYSIYRSWYRQKRPYDLPLPCTLAVCRNSRIYPPTEAIADGPGGAVNAFSVRSSDILPYLRNSALERFKNRLSDRASLGVTIAEFGQSLDMIANRAIQLRRFCLRLHRFDFRGAARELRMASVPKGTSVHKSFANNFLEFVFGWAPLVGDVWNAVQVLQSPVKDVKVSASANSKDHFVIQKVVEDGPWGFIRVSDEITGTYRVRCAASIRISNPNLWLANQLGLVNPLVVLLEKVPFSFVPNWFINLEEFLSQGTNFLGLTLLNPYSSESCKGIRVYRSRRLYLPDSPEEQVREGDFPVGIVQRTLGLPSISLTLRPLKVQSWMRSLTQVSLLIQQLRN